MVLFLVLFLKKYLTASEAASASFSLLLLLTRSREDFSSLKIEKIIGNLICWSYC